MCLLANQILLDEMLVATRVKADAGVVATAQLARRDAVIHLWSAGDEPIARVVGTQAKLPLIRLVMAFLFLRCVLRG